MQPGSKGGKPKVVKIDTEATSSMMTMGEEDFLGFQQRLSRIFVTGMEAKRSMKIRWRRKAWATMQQGKLEMCLI
jgi:hypothetical protein